MTEFVKAHDNPILLNLDYPTCLHEFAEELFRRGQLKAAVRNHYASLAGIVAEFCSVESA